MAAVDGTPAALNEFLDTLRLPDTADVLGPVPLPAPHDQAGEDRERALIRISRDSGRALATALAESIAARTARKEPNPVRVRLDPLELV
jgi:primosomal protein N' (replication factor Y)